MSLEREKQAAVISFTREGAKLAVRIAEWLNGRGFSCCGYEKRSRKNPEEGQRVRQAEGQVVQKAEARGVLQQVDMPLTQWAGEQFKTAGTLVFVGAAGIAVRAVAPWVSDKYRDPAVVVVDERGEFVIPLLSGHVGGGNTFARMLADALSAVAVITTATDIRGRFAVDVFAKEKGLWISDRFLAKAVSADILEDIPVGFYSDFPQIQAEDKPPKGCVVGESGNAADIRSHCSHYCRHHIYLSVFEQKHWRQEVPREGTLQLVPRVVVLGIGCRRGTAPEALRKEVFDCLERQGVRREAVKKVATIEQKKDEAAIKELCREQGWMFCCFSAEKLKEAEGEFSYSAFVEQTVGVGNVCERAAVLGGGRLLFPKQKLMGITLAAAVENGNAAYFLKSKNGEHE